MKTYRIKYLNFIEEIEVKEQWVLKASGRCKWMELKSFWYIKKEIEDRDGTIEEIK